MPLFVPILRLAMLFLNIYESYKMLKPPALSARNGGRPTQRALQQRKRDMKGCLAVWIVWSCLATYERFFESIISLFIPFYAEFKSLALLFLILTRARGAEPIYLHVIRPFLKPYTPALDSAFDLFHMIGDFLFALAMYPLRLVWEQWQASFYTYSYTSDVLKSESDNVPAHPPPDRTRMNTIPDGLPQSASSFADLGIGRPEGVKFPKKVNSDRPHGSRHASGESSRNVSRSQKVPEASSSQHQVWYPPASSYGEDYTSALPATQSNGPLNRSTVLNDTTEPELTTPAPIDEWRQYPPFPSAYPPTPLVTTVRSMPIEEPNDPNVTIVREATVDEWRKYPPFPSAYPPTPVITTSRIIGTSYRVPTTPRMSTSLDPMLYPPIPEDLPQQDFQRSLLPPREPLNPGYAGDLSDENNEFGVPSTYSNEDITLTSAPMTVDDEDDHISHDSMSSEDYEDEEDEFNVTLRTPLQPLGSFRSHVPTRGHISSIASSADTRSTALTTAADISSLHTRTSSGSSLSTSASITTNDSSLLSGKRLYTQNQATTRASVKTRVRELDAGASNSKQSASAMSAVIKPATIVRHKTPLKRRRISRSSRQQGVVLRTAEDDGASATATTEEFTSTATDSSLSEGGGDVDAESEINDPKAPGAKRRRVVASPPRIVNSARPIRPRVTRHASPPTKAPQQGKMARPVNVPGPSRASTRLRSGTSTDAGARSQTASSSSTSQTSLKFAITGNDRASASGPARTKAATRKAAEKKM